MTYVVAVLPWIHVRKGAAKPQPRSHPKNKDRRPQVARQRIPQALIDELLADFEALPRERSGRRCKHAVERLFESYVARGISKHYANNLCYCGLRDRPLA